MSSLRIASRYAKSLLDSAVQANKLEEVYADLRGLDDNLDENREFLLMLRSPIIPPEKKKSIMHAIYSGKTQDLTLTFFDTVIAKKREMFLPEIVKAFRVQYNERNKIAAAHLTTAVEPTQAILDEVSQVIKKYTTAEQVELTTAIDQSLIGGFVLQFEDKKYDTSIASKLEKLKKEFSKN